MTAPALIQPDSFLTLHYRLSGPHGDIINTFGGLPATLSLGNAELAPAIEQRLVGLSEGQHVTLELPAGQAYGQRNPDMLQWVPRQLLEQFGDAHTDYAVGEVVEFPAPDNQGRYAGAVQQVRADAVLFDFNHPLAGLPVTLEVQVIGVL
jgi:FKBP-type peptidyl-prolyl cis-trans isomerase SlpA